MKNLLTVLLTSFALWAISGCGTNAPKPPKIEPKIGYLISNGPNPYLYYQYLNNSKTKWRVYIGPQENLKHTCMPQEEFVQWYAYGKEVQEYILRLEEELAICERGNK